MSETEELWISGYEAARIMGKSPRQVARMATTGDVERDPDNKLYLKSSVLAWKDSAEEQGLEEGGVKLDEFQANVVMSRVVKQALEHNERMMRIYESATKCALESATQTNSKLMERIKDQESTQIETMKALGDLLLRKDEREALAREEERRSVAASDTLGLLKKAMPKLLSQMGGKGGVLFDLFEKLDEGEKNGIAQLYYAFEDDEKKLLFKESMKVLGIQIPPQEIVEEATQEEDAQ